MDSEKIRIEFLERANRNADDTLRELSAMTDADLLNMVCESLNVNVICDLDHGYRYSHIYLWSYAWVHTDDGTLKVKVGDQYAYRVIPDNVLIRIDKVVSYLFDSDGMVII